MELTSILEGCITCEYQSDIFLSGYIFYFTQFEMLNSIKKIKELYGDIGVVFVLNFIQKWFRDFGSRDFIENKRITYDLFELFKKDKNLIKEIKLSFLQINQMKQKIDTFPPIKIPEMININVKRRYYHEHNIHPIEVCKQIDFISRFFIKSIPLSKINTIKLFINNENVKKYIHLSNHVSNHVISNIISLNKKKQILKEIKYYFQVCELLIEIQNYDMAYSIFAGLFSFEVTRFKKAWETINKEKVQRLFDDNKNFENYRNVISDENDYNFVPIIPIILKDLTAISEIESEIFDVHTIFTIGRILRPVVYIYNEHICFDRSILSRKFKSIFFIPSFTKEKIQKDSDKYFDTFKNFTPIDLSIDLSNVHTTKTRTRSRSMTLTRRIKKSMNTKSKSENNSPKSENNSPKSPLIECIFEDMAKK